ncbi:9925_t:CDS:2 [Cetraspora pellucida]|uniref:9925_t:CDS:1 n=1 Tax=Cetraspora pellucida TaxID=1433469 RepID=A0A9N9HPZ2_9GLOM|nr:9925_t:CDS:2 [Cetraspora pellucida]
MNCPAAHVVTSCFCSILLTRAILFTYYLHNPFPPKSCGRRLALSTKLDLRRASSKDKRTIFHSYFTYIAIFDDLILTTLYSIKLTTQFSNPR